MEAGRKAREVKGVKVAASAAFHRHVHTQNYLYAAAMAAGEVA